MTLFFNSFFRQLNSIVFFGLLYFCTFPIAYSADEAARASEVKMDIGVVYTPISDSDNPDLKYLIAPDIRIKAKKDQMLMKGRIGTVIEMSADMKEGTDEWFYQGFSVRNDTSGFRGDPIKLGAKGVLGRFNGKIAVSPLGLRANAGSTNRNVTWSPGLLTSLGIEGSLCSLFIENRNALGLELDADLFLSLQAECNVSVGERGKVRLYLNAERNWNFNKSLPTNNRQIDNYSAGAGIAF